MIQPAILSILAVNWERGRFCRAAVNPRPGAVTRRPRPFRPSPVERRCSDAGADGPRIVLGADETHGSEGAKAEAQKLSPGNFWGDFHGILMGFLDFDGIFYGILMGFLDFDGILMG